LENENFGRFFKSIFRKAKIKLKVLLKLPGVLGGKLEA